MNKETMRQVFHQRMFHRGKAEAPRETDSEKRRAVIDAQVEEFLKAGGEIEQCPSTLMANPIFGFRQQQQNVVRRV